MFGPTVDEGICQVFANVKLCLNDSVHACNKPVFVVAVLWQNDTGPERANGIGQTQAKFAKVALFL
jgi:hypothetical protein